MSLANSTPVTAEEKRELVCLALANARALDLRVLEVRDITILADYFIIATATSTVHSTAIGRGVREQLKREHGLRCVPEGDQESNWIIMDYGDVVAHVMSGEMREFYQLEKLWAEANAWTWVDPAGSTACTDSDPEAGDGDA